MVKLSKLLTEAEIHEQDMHDVDYRREVERTQFANDVAIKVIHYRVSRRACPRPEHPDDRHAAAQYRPARTRREHEPSLSTLARLSSVLGVDFSVEVEARAPQAPEPSPSTSAAHTRGAAGQAKRRRTSHPHKDRRIG